MGHVGERPMQEYGLESKEDRFIIFFYRSGSPGALRRGDTHRYQVSGAQEPVDLRWLCNTL